MGSDAEGKNCGVALRCRSRIHLAPPQLLQCLLQHSARLREGDVDACAPSRVDCPTALAPNNHCDRVRVTRRRKWGPNCFGQSLDTKKSSIPTSVLGMARLHDFSSLNYFFTKLTALNSSFAYFTYNSNELFNF